MIREIKHRTRNTQKNEQEFAGIQTPGSLIHTTVKK